LLSDNSLFVDYHYLLLTVGGYATFCSSTSLLECCTHGVVNYLIVVLFGRKASVFVSKAACLVMTEYLHFVALHARRPVGAGLVLD